jgi:vacuolar protein sorting-associated protein 13A/C
VGLLDSGAKILGTMSKGLKKLNIDEGGAAAGRPRAPAKPQDVFQGVGWGLQALGYGVVTGVTGIVVDPVRGASQSGLLGAAKGLAGGVIGVVTKPTAGALDLVALSMKGLVATLGATEGVSRDRLPRFIANDGTLHVSAPLRSSEV